MILRMQSEVVRTCKKRTDVKFLCLLSLMFITLEYSLFCSAAIDDVVWKCKQGHENIWGTETLPWLENINKTREQGGHYKEEGRLKSFCCLIVANLENWIKDRLLWSTAGKKWDVQCLECKEVACQEVRCSIKVLNFLEGFNKILDCSNIEMGEFQKKNKQLLYSYCEILVSNLNKYQREITNTIQLLKEDMRSRLIEKGCDTSKLDTRFIDFYEGLSKEFVDFCLTQTMVAVLMQACIWHKAFKIDSELLDKEESMGVYKVLSKLMPIREVIVAHHKACLAMVYIDGDHVNTEHLVFNGYRSNKTVLYKIDQFMLLYANFLCELPLEYVLENVKSRVQISRYRSCLGWNSDDNIWDEDKVNYVDGWWFCDFTCSYNLGNSRHNTSELTLWDSQKWKELLKKNTRCDEDGEIVFSFYRCYQKLQKSFLLDNVFFFDSLVNSDCCKQARTVLLSIINEHLYNETWVFGVGNIVIMRAPDYDALSTVEYAPTFLETLDQIQSLNKKKLELFEKDKGKKMNVKFNCLFVLGKILNIINKLSFYTN